MVNYSQFFDCINQVDNYSQKAHMLAMLINAFNDKKFKISAEDRKIVSDFLFSEIQRLIPLIPTVEDYKVKDEIFEYEDNLIGLVMKCHASAAEISQTNILLIQTLIAVVDKERFIETGIDDIFANGNNDRERVQNLINDLSSIKDEYQKGQFYRGILHYRQNISKLPADSKALLSDYLKSELKRYLGSEISDDITINLELASDASKFFINDEIASLLNEALNLGISRLNYYVVSTLLDSGMTVPKDVIVALANDVEFADLTYAKLRQHNATEMFPKELATEEYLAKSDLVHWLTYPTELGKQPDQIEYLGKVKKKEIYHIFRYTSDSDNLEDKLKGKWLIGWSNDEGGTFSNFDLYESFEQKTLEKTLKYIKKKLL